MTSLPENNYSTQRLCLTSLPDIVKTPSLWKTETLAFPFLQPKFFSSRAAVILDPIQLPRIRTELCSLILHRSRLKSAPRQRKPGSDLHTNQLLCSLDGGGKAKVAN